MANTGFVVINATHNIGHGKFVLLVSSPSVLIILLVVATIFVAVHTNGQSKLSFHFQSCLLVSNALNRSSVSLAEPDSSSTRLFINNALHIDCCNYSLGAKYEHVQNRSNLFEREENDF